MGISVNDCTVYCDNQGAISLAGNRMLSQRSKHIDIRYHFIRDLIQKGQIRVVHVDTEANLADIFTKPLMRVKFNKFRGPICNYFVN